jgi:hypothetical protein
MHINTFLKDHFHQLDLNDIAEDNDFSDYDIFRKFIHEHYSLSHLKSNNYIKYVKVKRQMLKLSDEKRYMDYIHKIDDVIKIMNDYHIFPNILIKNYMYKLSSIFKIIEERKTVLLESITNIRKVFNLKNDDKAFKFKIITGINCMIRKFQLLKKYSNQLVSYINDFMTYEETYDIDHKLIELHNMHRCFLGKRSEYVANKVFETYVNSLNSRGEKTYFYETNVNLIKMLHIGLNVKPRIKGEIDGLIISYDGETYMIEKIIEVKSSVKSTFDDTKKFFCLQNFIKSINFSGTIKYKNYIFTKNSFSNIINKHLTHWIIYVCIGQTENNIIEKSHLYFSTVLKIIDDSFIKSFYLEKSEDAIKEKHKIIMNNKAKINDLFIKWKKNIKLGSFLCNVFISK